MSTKMMEQLPACRLDATPYGDPYLACNLEPYRTASSQIAKEVFTYPRPVECENPLYAYKNATNKCQFRASNHTTSCGCPELNNPELKEAYQDTVCDAVLLLAEKKNEITLTFFASGGLRNECQLITLILEELNEIKWEGKLHLQFIDPVYTINKTQTVMSEQTNVNWGCAIGAGVVGLAGIGSLVAGTRQKKKEHQYACSGGGAALIVLALILAANIEEPVKTREIKPLSIKAPVLNAIQGKIETLRAQVPEGITLDASYFPNEAACRQATYGRKTDGLFGYDIGGRGPVEVNGKVEIRDSYQDYLTMKREGLSHGGYAALVYKVGVPGKMGTPVFETAKGSKPMKPQSWK